MGMHSGISTEYAEKIMSRTNVLEKILIFNLIQTTKSIYYFVGYLISHNL